MSSFRSFARRFGFDLLIVVAAIETALEVSLTADSARAPRTTLWFIVPAIVLVVLALLLRRQFAFGAPAIFWILGAALSFVDGRLLVYPAGIFVAGMAAALLFGHLRDIVQARIGLVIVLCGATMIVYNDPRSSAGEFIFIPVLFAVSWLAGFALRGRTEQAEVAEERASRAEREREAVARIAVAEERAMIARELHDIVAHSVSVMVLQVGAVRHRLPSALADDRDALKDVEQAGRTALAEMRRLLGAMRHEDEDLELLPHPGLDSLDSLLEEIRRAGLPVSLKVDGERFPLPRALDLSAYRIVQEGLTNVLKHARARQADVVVRYGTGELEIEVHDDGDGHAPNDGLGHGLIGVRERVKVYGGEMTARTAAAGGFTLSTRLPLGGGSS